jgi:hypothetical protein
MLVLHYPDVSSFDAGINFGNAYVVCAKATQGTNYTNPEYAGFEAQAKKDNVYFTAYHFLTQGNGKAQAQHYCSVVGQWTPGMVDVEPATGSKPSVQDAIDFVQECHRQGRPMQLLYFPHWYWEQIGSPKLDALANLDMVLVTSDYTTYSDTGPGWQGYGDMHVGVWQYSSTEAYGGIANVDFNAFKGSGNAKTYDDLMAEFRSIATTGKLPQAATVPPKPAQAITLAGTASDGRDFELESNDTGKTWTVKVAPK